MAKSGFKMTPESLRRFQKNLEDMEDFTGAEMPKVIRNGARDFCKKGMRYTPMARGRVRGKGFAKSGWILPMKKLGMKVIARHGTRGGGKGPTMGDYVKRGNKKKLRIEVANQVPYIQDLDIGSSQNKAYHISQKALDATNHAMGKTIKRLAARQKIQWLS
jgi:hypothetical protein